MRLSADEDRALSVEVRRKIEAAFVDTPYPGNGYDDISATRQDDEGIVEYFRGAGWCGHDVKSLRRHASALSLFTDRAFRFWLPAFMLAELDDPETADVVADGIAYTFDDSRRAASRLSVFSADELDAVAAFLGLCVRRHAFDEMFGEHFRRAEQRVRARRSEIWPLS